MRDMSQSQFESALERNGIKYSVTPMGPRFAFPCGLAKYNPPGVNRRAVLAYVLREIHTPSPCQACTDMLARSIRA